MNVRYRIGKIYTTTYIWLVQCLAYLMRHNSYIMQSIINIDVKNIGKRLTAYAAIVTISNDNVIGKRA
jgi:hypothetical protein